MNVNATTIVGGIPNPIGGVTTFIKRLVENNPDAFCEIYDLYKSDNKVQLKNFRGKYIASGRVRLIIDFFRRNKDARKTVFFNFSTSKSLIFLFFVRKRRADIWYLMLHHGELKSRLPLVLQRIALNKFDKIYALSSSQKAYYSMVGVASSVHEAKSYVPPVKEPPEAFFSELINDIRRKYKKIYVTSGFPRKEYNISWSIEKIRSFEDSALIVFVYGDGNLLDSIRKEASEITNVYVFYNESERNFNYALSISSFYLRPTDKDSFGVAVADAIELGSTAIASDVCKRYQGCYLFETGKKNDYFNLIDSLRSPASFNLRVELEKTTPFSI